MSKTGQRNADAHRAAAQLMRGTGKKQAAPDAREQARQQDAAKVTRLRDLRLAKEAADRDAAAKLPVRKPRKKAAIEVPRSNVVRVY